MAGDDTFDVIVLGAGTGGYSCALRAAQLGLSVGLVERDKVGGTCLHRGCIPSKALLQTAQIADHVRDAGEFGVRASFEGLEIAQVHEHKDNVVTAMWKGLQGALKGRGITTLEGHGRLVDRGTVEVDGDRYRADALVAATGSVPRTIPPAPFDGERIINSDHALQLDRVPERPVILGAGAIGMEFASVWHGFGAEKVTVVEVEERVLPLEDPDSSREIARQFRSKGIQLMTDARLTAADPSDGGVVVTVETNDGEEKLECDILLVAIGRKPVTEDCGYEEVGLQLERGSVAVDELCRTSVEGVWALGDLIPTLGLAHASFAEGFLVADQLGGLDVVPIDYAGVPRVTFSHPEVASVGLTEPQAKEQGHDVVVERYKFQTLARARMMKAEGVVKIVAARADDGAGRILGIHLTGPHATDLIAEAELIHNWEALPMDVARFVHPHPTLNEAIGEAHLALAGRALHG
ncbi:MAG TPA: dihydrolipoyl dehydrogenase [Nitriliruptorales bacterium]|nr:dihydrolipoyl dehydrogenase [Nitriliruptorales bacterium]